MKRKFVISVQLMMLATLVSLFPVELRAQDAGQLTWREYPSLPDELGVAGPFAGVHNDALIVAGGANFPRPVWKSSKVWRDRIFVLIKRGNGFTWLDGGQLPRPTAYGAAVSTPHGVVCIGGNDATNTFRHVMLLKWDPTTSTINMTEYPSLPKPCAFGAAAFVGQTIYLAGGQQDASLRTAMTNFWMLDLSQRQHPKQFVWKKLTPWPGAARALNLTVHQHNGMHDCVYVISGRRQNGSDARSTEFLTDVWEYSVHNKKWRRRADVPRCVMAGVGIADGANRILVLGGADGSLFFRADELKDQHPGFPKQALAYQTDNDSWTQAGPLPQNQVTTIAVRWNTSIVIPSGEVRPRVRSPKVWHIQSNGGARKPR